MADALNFDKFVQKIITVFKIVILLRNISIR